MSATFYDEVQQLRRRYPNPLSAVLPALQLAQERNGGWLSEATLREAADALELTPAYCLSIASFYDMFHTEPVGRHVIERQYAGVTSSASATSRNAASGSQPPCASWASRSAGMIAERGLG